MAARDVQTEIRKRSDRLQDDISPPEEGGAGILDNTVGSTRRGNIGVDVALPWISAIVGRNPVVPVVDVHGDDDRAQQMTVHLGSVRDDGLSNNVALKRATAIVQWGVGGGFHACEIDCVQGTAFSLIASSLKVSLRNDSPQEQPLRAGAYVGYATRPGSDLPPIRTLDCPSSAGTAIPAGQPSNLIVIPSFARSCRPEFQPVTGSAILAQYRDVAGNLICENNGEEMLFPDTARIVRIVNAALAAITRCQLVFRIGL